MIMKTKKITMMMNMMKMVSITMEGLGYEIAACLRTVEDVDGIMNSGQL